MKNPQPQKNRDINASIDFVFFDIHKNVVLIKEIFLRRIT